MIKPKSVLKMTATVVCLFSITLSLISFTPYSTRSQVMGDLATPSTDEVSGARAIESLKASGTFDSLKEAVTAAMGKDISNLGRTDAPSAQAAYAEFTLTASDGAQGDTLGVSISISGNTAVVGASDDDIGSNANQGSAYVFVRIGTNWSQQAKLTASDGAADDEFGFSVGVSGNTAIVGARNHDIGSNNEQGAAYVFVRSGTSWTQQTKLTSTDGALGDNFGISVAVSGNTAVVGAFGDEIGSSRQGSAYVFARSGTTWTQQAKLITSDGAPIDQAGRSVAISGDTAVIGANQADVGANTDQGAAYVFTRSGSTWSQQAKLTATDGAAYDNFGNSVSISGDTVAVGAQSDDNGANTGQGSAYVFTRSGSTWTQQAKLVASDGGYGDRFGTSVSIFGDTVAVGAPFAYTNQENERGATWVFTRTGTTWTQQTKLYPFSGTYLDRLGWSAAVWGRTVVAGAPYDDIGSTVDQGSVSAFTDTALPCSYALDESAASISNAGGTIDIPIISDGGCSWTATSNSAWITVFAGSSGAGNATVTLSIPANYSQARTGTVTVGGKTFTVTQDAACSYSIDSPSAGMPRTGGTLNVAVTTTSVCSWTATSNDTWISVSSGSSGSGDGTVGLTVSTNTGGARIGTVTIAGETYTVAQGGGTSGDPFSEIAIPSADGSAGPYFGYSVAISGDTAVIGVPYASLPPGGNNHGAAYVFVKSGANWIRQAKLTAPDAAISDFFGRGVSISGDSIVVGASAADVGSNANQGSLYVFVRLNGTWSFQAKLVASDGTASDFLGSNVSIDGDTVVGAADADESFKGSAYVFVRSGTTWTQQAKLVASDGQAGDGFGSDVSVSGDTVVVGASNDDVGSRVNQGSAYVFVRSGSVWTEQANLATATGGSNEYAGSSVSVSGDTAIVGATNTSVGSNPSQGSAFVFVRSGGVWTQQTTLVATDGATGDDFGTDVSVSGDTAIIGAPLDDVSSNTDQGSAYTFVRTGSTWTQQQKLTATDGAAGDKFGSSVATFGGTMVVGAPYDDIGTSADQGSVKIFVPSVVTCTYTLNRTSAAVSFVGGSVTVGVSAPGSCAWTAVSNDSWITVSSGASGTGDGVVSVSVSSNSGGARTGTVTIGGQTLTVTQESGCSYTVAPSGTQSVSAAGGNVVLSVSTASTCTWSSGSETSWIVVATGQGGMGNGTVTLAVSQNTGATRTGTASVAGQTVTIEQAGASQGSVAGTVRYYFGSTPHPVPGVVLTGSGTTTVSATTDLGGGYRLENFSTGPYNVAASKTGNVTGISSLDASRVAQYAAGLVTLTANQLIAADASNNGTVSSLDASRIAQYVAGLSSGTNVTGTWKFSPSSRSYSSVTSAVTGEDYSAILVGDVTGNWAPPVTLSEPEAEQSLVEDALSRTGRPFAISFRGRRGELGDVVTVPVTVGDLTNRGITAFDMEVSYDPNVLEPVIDRAADNVGTISANLSVTANPNIPGRLIVSAYGIAPIAGEGTLINLVFRVKGSDGARTRLKFERILLNEESFSAPDRVLVVGRRR